MTINFCSLHVVDAVLCGWPPQWVCFKTSCFFLSFYLHLLTSSKFEAYSALLDFIQLYSNYSLIHCQLTDTKWTVHLLLQLLSMSHYHCVQMQSEIQETVARQTHVQPNAFNKCKVFQYNEEFIDSLSFLFSVIHLIGSVFFMWQLCAWFIMTIGHIVKKTYI